MTPMMLAALLLAAPSFLISPALADKPEKHDGGHGQSGKSSAGKKGRDGGDTTNVNIVMNTGDQVLIRDYYGGAIRGGHCPPGLAKKNNGCLPPGQAKKWAKGRPLPRDVVFYELPRDLAIRLNPPPGARYVRVAADILLIAAGTGMVLDALEDLSRR
jgi:hypothetical protein